MAAVELVRGEVETVSAVLGRSASGSGVSAAPSGARTKAAPSAERGGARPGAVSSSAGRGGATTGAVPGRTGRRTGAAVEEQPGTAAQPALGEQTPARSAGRGRAVLLLVLFLVGSALAAVGVALAVGAVWQEVYAWVLPQVIGDKLTG